MVMDFVLKEEEIEFLYESGYILVKCFLEKWDFEQYKMNWIGWQLIRRKFL